MRRVLSMVAVVLLVLGTTGSAAAAKVLRTETSGTQQVTGPPDLSEARTWQAGPIEQARGLRITLVQQDSTYGTADVHVVANQRIDTRTSSGRGWGTWRSDFGDGGFEGSFQGSVAGGSATWQVVGHGWGDKRGEQVRGTVTEDLTTGSSSYTGTLQIPPGR